MSTGKRASMREGPLAALFRRTDEDQSGERSGPPPAPPAERELAAAEARPAVPPHERLRQVFSSDIPENILDRPSSAPAPAPEAPREAVLRVVGVGGAGVNAVDRMIEAGVQGIEFIALNTDVQSLGQSDAHLRLHIGEDLTRGLGAGADPELGRQACLAEYDRLKGMLKGSDMVFIAAGEGGGTGTGAAPIVARIAREVGALTVAIVTKPFAFEGSRRAAQADLGIDMLAAEVDTLIVVPNARLLTALEKRTSMVEAFRVADDVLRQGVQGISDLITLPGLINLDFADVRTVMSDAGQALLGIGMGTGEHRATEAAERAVASPLLETSVEGARSILLSITAGRDFSLWEVNEAARAVAEAAHPDANIIFGAMVDEKVDDQVWVTVVATGFGDAPAPRRDTAREREPALVGAGASTGTGSSSGGRAGRPRDRVEEIDVPEFIPRG